MIQTKVFVTARRGENLLIEPNVTTSPSGMASTSVEKNSWRLMRNPPLREDTADDTLDMISKNISE